jgi:hypothetical protein
MDDLTGLHAFSCVHERREQRTVVFHPVPRNVNDYDTEGQLLEVVLMLKTFVGRNQDVTLALSLSNQLCVRERAPFGFRDGQHFMIGESLPETRINALV